MSVSIGPSHAHSVTAPTPPSIARAQPGWQRFLAGARSDAATMREAAKKLSTSVVVLGGTGVRGAPQLARELGAHIGQAGLPLRTIERPGAAATLVASARAANPDLKLELVSHGGPQFMGDATRVTLETRELGKRTALENASAYVVLPGDVETLWELAGLWSLLKIWMIPAKPVILVGSEQQWRAVLQPFIDKALADGTIPTDALGHLVYAPTVQEAVKLAATAHAQSRPRKSPRLAKLADDVLHDVAMAERLMPKCAGPRVVYGGAALKEESKAFQRIEAAAAELGGPWCTGLGYGAMLAALRGAKAADPNALNQGVAIRIRGEPKVNDYVDEGRYFVARVLEVRQRLVLEMGKTAHIVEDGGIGTLFELYQLLKLLEDRELSAAPVMVSEYYRETLEATGRMMTALGIDPKALDRVRYYQDKEELVGGLKGGASA